jgi:NAD(P)-dependent dehydrogenase (short-subunit alcohol dehydrogenase family)
LGIATIGRTVGKDGAHPLAPFAKVINVNVFGSFNMIRLAAEATCIHSRQMDARHLAFNASRYIVLA